MNTEAQSWLPRLEAEVRRLGALQLQGARELDAAQIRVKRVAGDEDSLVTDSDLESERQFHAFVRREFPEHSFLGEESGNEPRDPEHYWIIDPIDGTTNFAHGIPYWGPSVAYWRHGKPELALIYFPALDRMFTAARGHGARCNGTPIHSSTATAYSSLTTVGLHSRTHYTHHLRLRAKVRVLGSIIGNMCLTAQGTFVATHGRGRLWDLAAGILILQESGAQVETLPDVQTVAPASYGVPGGATPLFHLQARANTQLPRLSEYLEDATTAPLP